MEFFEILLILLVGFLVLGPKRLVEVSYRIGRYFGYLNRLGLALRHDFEKSVNSDERKSDERKKSD